MLPRQSLPLLFVSNVEQTQVNLLWIVKAKAKKAIVVAKLDLIFVSFLGGKMIAEHERTSRKAHEKRRVSDVDLPTICNQITRLYSRLSSQVLVNGGAWTWSEFSANPSCCER